MWGSCRIVTGLLSDRWGRKGLIVAGMRVPAAGCAPIALMMRERH
ncbi:major facilitator superfamily (MFS_1) transporter domain protein [Burkholderia cepacia]|nr:major facilitator superfamily (MFS_1) transporter domain protein [Burkholderia cepacia]